MSKKKEYHVDAFMDEETYEAFKSGRAVDNNGLRSPKGSYWPKQPSYRMSPSVKDQMKQYGQEMAVDVSNRLVHEVGVPMIERLVREEIYPAIAERIHNWLHPVAEATSIKTAQAIENERRNSNVINLNEYRKRA